MAAKAERTNDYAKIADKLREYIEEIEEIKDEIDSETGAFMKRVKDKKSEIKNLIADAKNEGIPTKALRAELKLREFDRKKDKVVAGLEESDADELEMIRDALGDFASLPLGDAALRRATA